MLKKSSSQELLHQMGQYLAWSIARTERFKFVQMKSPRSQMAPPQRLKLLHSNIYIEKGLKNLLKNCCTKWDNI